jgi:hypothetical protein
MTRLKFFKFLRKEILAYNGRFWDWNLENLRASAGNVDLIRS